MLELKGCARGSAWCMREGRLGWVVRHGRADIGYWMKGPPAGSRRLDPLAAAFRPTSTDPVHTPQRILPLVEPRKAKLYREGPQDQLVSSIAAASASHTIPPCATHFATRPRSLGYCAVPRDSGAGRDVVSSLGTSITAHTRQPPRGSVPLVACLPVGRSCSRPTPPAARKMPLIRTATR